MPYTKDNALHDQVLIDGTDASNAFRSFGLESEDAEEDASGFSVSGTDESLAGSRKQAFVGEAFYTPESYALLWPLYEGREVFECVWQPQGLVASTRETYVGNVRLVGFSPQAVRGQVRAFNVRMVAADEDGISPTTGS